MSHATCTVRDAGAARDTNPLCRVPFAGAGSHQDKQKSAQEEAEEQKGVWLTMMAEPVVIVPPITGQPGPLCTGLDSPAQCAPSRARQEKNK